MVCNRCIMAVQSLLEQHGLAIEHVTLGEALLAHELPETLLPTIAAELQALGFELIDDRRHRLAEQVRVAVIELVHYSDTKQRTNLSDYIADKLGVDYDTAAELFSTIHGTTVEKFYIAQKIERVKELLAYDELSLNEIAYRMGYSSAAHLSTQFKRVTGMTPTAFRQSRHNRLPLDEI